jgi:hypothetical protein
MGEKLKALARKLKISGLLKRLQGLSRRRQAALLFVLVFAGLGVYTLWPSHADPIAPGTPAVASWGQGHLDLFARGNDGAVWHRWYLPTYGWSGWSSLGGYCNSEPAARSWGYGRIDIFCVAGSNNTMYHKWFDGSWDHPWEPLGGNFISGPAAASWGSGRLDIFGIGTDHALWHKWFNGGWSGWESLGGYLTSTPAAVSWGYGRVDIVAKGGNNEMYHKWFNGGWSGWESLGGGFISGPAIASWGSGHLDIFGIGTNHEMYHKYIGSGYGWSSWQSLGGYLTTSPAAVAWSYGRIDAFARSSDNNVWHKWFDPSQCSTGWCPGWENMGGNQLPPPLPVAPPPTTTPQTLAPAPGPPTSYAQGNVVGCTKSDPYKGCVGSWWFAHGGPEVYDASNGAKLSGYIYVDDTTPCNPSEAYPMNQINAPDGSPQCVQSWVTYFRGQNPTAVIYAALAPGTSVSTRIRDANATLIEWYPASASGQPKTATCGANGYILQRYYVGGSVSTVSSTQWSGFPTLWTSAENCLVNSPNTVLSYY